MSTTKKSKKKSTKKSKQKVFLSIIVIIIMIAAALVTFYRTQIAAEEYDEQTTELELDNPESEAVGETVKESADTSSKPKKEKNDSKKADSKAKETEELPPQSLTSSALEIPLCPATKKGSAKDHEVHTYSGFTLCYRESYEQAEWVAYTLTKAELKAVIGRTDDFRADTQISTGSAEPADYKSSGYDRGHLAPAADMEWSEQSCRESFLMSNMSPQTGNLNRGTWKELEEEVRNWAARFGEVVVVTGPVLEKPAAEYKSIGKKNRVAVPEYYYKALLANTQDDDDSTTIGIGFILPNENCGDDIWEYACSIDEVEKRTKLDFFAALDDEYESKIEKSKNFSAWK